MTIIQNIPQFKYVSKNVPKYLSRPLLKLDLVASTSPSCEEDIANRIKQGIHVTTKVKYFMVT